MRNLVLVAFVLAMAPCLVGQEPTPAKTSDVRFEVASVKPNNSGSTTSSQRVVPFQYINVPLRTLIRFAYGIQDFQLVGAPAWIDSDKFDIVTKAEGTPSREDTARMVEQLLHDRFKLQARREMRAGSIYLLVMAKSDGRLGEHLHRSDADCTALATQRPPECLRNVIPSNAHGMPIQALSSWLAFNLQQPVEDHTGLTGPFDFDLHWNRLGTPDSPEPALPTALEEQFGLKLERRQGSFEAVVIDHVERPTPD